MKTPYQVSQSSTIVLAGDRRGVSPLLKPSNFIMPLVLIVITICYYQVYQHYWLSQLFGGRILRLGYLILPLCYVVLIYELMSRKIVVNRKGTVFTINMILAIYIFLSVVSIFLNHSNYNDIRIYSFYTGYPVLLYFIIVRTFKNVHHIKLAMRVLFVLGILLSLYSVYLFLSYDLSSVPPIETSIGEVRADTGGSFTGGGGIGVGRLDRDKESEALNNGYSMCNN